MFLRDMGQFVGVIEECLILDCTAHRTETKSRTVIKTMSVEPLRVYVRVW